MLTANVLTFHSIKFLIQACKLLEDLFSAYFNSVPHSPRFTMFPSTLSSPFLKMCQVYSGLKAFGLCIRTLRHISDALCLAFNSSHKGGNCLHSVFAQDPGEYNISLWIPAKDLLLQPHCDVGSPQNSLGTNFNRLQVQRS